MVKRTLDEINAEIAALRRLVPTGIHREKTGRGIQTVIEELQYSCDMTTDEFSDLSEYERELIRTTREWKEGYIQPKPSTEWTGLVEIASP